MFDRIKKALRKESPQLVGTELDQAPMKNWREENWRINIYKCTRTDDHLLTTVDVSDGVAPFIVSCPKCKANAVSCMYPRMRPIPPEVPRISHELYSPLATGEAIVGDAETLEYVQQGGLLMRKLTGNFEPLSHNDSAKSEVEIYGNTAAEKLDAKEKELQAKAEKLRQRGGGQF